jgi:hypothetical protein
MNLSELSIVEIEYRGYPAVKAFPKSGKWSKGGLHKDEARILVLEAGYEIKEDDPYLLKANEFFQDLGTLESVQAFVFFKKG